MKKKNAILAVSINYDFEVIAPFFESLNNHFDGELYVLTNRKYKIPQTYSYRTIFEDADIFLNNLPVKLNSINNSRFYWYLDILRRDPYIENIFLTDIRDVFFQSDPFNWKDDGILAAQEDQFLQNCPFNQDWIKALYGDSFYETYKESSIYCCGTILGSYEYMFGLLIRMCEQLDMHGPRLDSNENKKYIDQGIFNYYVYEKVGPVLENKNSTGIIYTMGYGTQFLVNAKGQFCNARNEPYAVLHQYDRFPWIVDMVKNKYSAKPQGLLDSLKSRLRKSFPIF